MQSLQTVRPRRVGREPKVEPANLVPIEHESRRLRTSDRVFAQLLAAIRNLSLVPGQALSETDLADQLGVSRTPLREAIARLADSGLVVVVPQVGTRVSLISMSEVEQAQFVRETLEVGAFGAACKRAPVDTTVLRQLLENQQRALADSDFDAFFGYDEALHEQIFYLSGFPGAWAAVQGMKVQLDRLRRLMPDHATIGALIAEHTTIVDALEAGNYSAGKRCIAVHARRVLQYAPGIRMKFPDYFTN